MRNVTERKYMADSSADLYLVTAPGLEHITAAELIALGMTPGGETHGVLHGAARCGICTVPICGCVQPRGCCCGHRDSMQGLLPNWSGGQRRCPGGASS